ncbi:MAG: penicillin-binding protein 2 [Rhizobiaceae bacterium]
MSQEAVGSDIVQTGGVASQISLQGASKAAGEQARSRVFLAILIIGLVYATIIGRLAYLGAIELDGPSSNRYSNLATSATRPDIVDRNGNLLATDIITSSLFAEPRRIVDVDEAVELLTTVLPELDVRAIHRKLASKAGFVWLKRELTPKIQSEILALGIPGIGFRSETKRFYPKGETLSHLVGYVDIDNVGIAGLEKYIDGQGLNELRNAGFAQGDDMKPVKLSIDTRVQHFIRDELAKAMDRYDAIGAGAVVLNIHTGEIVGMASLPDFNSNSPADAQKKDRLNRMTAGTYEMGSTFKTFTTAMALDSGLVNLKSKFDATKPLRIAGFTINDFHAKRRVLSVPEVFIYSSNIGTAKMAEVVGIKGHREFLHRIGLLEKMQLELPEVARPKEPKVWKKINSVTISYGHGAQTTPLQTAVAAAALMNGGMLIPPTLFPRSHKQAEQLAKRVVQKKTSDSMRYLMRLNVEKGSGRRAEVPGFRVGGKTGTAEKVVNGRYSSKVRFNSFLAVFPIDNPKYVVLSIIDEPKPEAGKKSATAGLNAAPIVRNIIRRAAPVLGIQPKFGNAGQPLYVRN